MVWRHSHEQEYDVLIEEYIKRRKKVDELLQKVEHTKKDILRKSILYLLSKILFCLILCILLGVSIALFLKVHPIVAIILLVSGASLIINNWTLSSKARERALKRSSDIIQPKEEEAEHAKNGVEGWYRHQCEIFPSYPPDWDERRKQVLERDRHHCVECGYPDGFKRRSRELHIHHKISLSDGGNNSLENLITLCHICHRGIDSKHKGVRKLNKAPRGRYRRYRRY